MGNLGLTHNFHISSIYKHLYQIIINMTYNHHMHIANINDPLFRFCISKVSFLSWILKIPFIIISLIFKFLVSAYMNDEPMLISIKLISLVFIHTWMPILIMLISLAFTNQVISIDCPVHSYSYYFFPSLSFFKDNKHLHKRQAQFTYLT